MNTFQSLRASYARLPVREQRWLLAGITALTLFLGYALILAPTLTGIRRASLETAHERRLYAWIEREQPALSARLSPTQHLSSPQTVQMDLHSLVKSLPDPLKRIHLSEPHPDVWKIRVDQTQYAQALSQLLPFIVSHHLSIRRLRVRRSSRKSTAVNIILEISLHAHSS
ncbi:MAG: type II secretion system protein GspM [Gammaproteobacteria bacterium]